MQKPISLAGQIYHVYHGGTEKQSIFNYDEDKSRFIHNLYEFNDDRQSFRFYVPKKRPLGRPLTELQSRKLEREPQRPLVELLTFSLLNNHFHLLVKLVRDHALSAFMRKLSTGYTMYFNKKYKSTGAVFQGSYRTVLIEHEPYLLPLAHYIHCCALDMVMPAWREGNIPNHEKAIEFLKTYKWSGFPDYIGKKNFPTITQRKSLSRLVGGPGEYKRDLLRWLKTPDIAAITPFVLEGPGGCREDHDRNKHKKEELSHNKG